jgi:hypothetical protein
MIAMSRHLRTWNISECLRALGAHFDTTAKATDLPLGSFRSRRAQVHILPGIVRYCRSGLQTAAAVPFACHVADDGRQRLCCGA